MKAMATTRMSSKGQVVIPELIRQQLQLREGAQFVVVGDRDTIVLKTIEPPTLEGLEELLQEAKVQALKAGMKPSDVARATEKVRGQK
jgi:AbrB family looped-hinge helix DNA binding protein